MCCSKLQGAQLTDSYLHCSFLICMETKIASRQWLSTTGIGPFWQDIELLLVLPKSFLELHCMKFFLPNLFPFPPSFHRYHLHVVLKLSLLSPAVSSNKYLAHVMLSLHLLLSISKLSSGTNSDLRKQMVRWGKCDWLVHSLPQSKEVGRWCTDSPWHKMVA